jgi:hypothetical protein
MKLRFAPRVMELLEGAVDMHIHSAPDVYPRIQSDVELAAQARENGMRAIVIKNHFFPTGARSQVASEVAGFPVYGGIALNLPVGGLNAYAVEFALKMGAKIVWLPTLHARKFIQNKDHLKNLAGELGEDIQGVYLFEEDDRTLNPELSKIFRLIATRGAILATGHISVKEARAAVKAAAEAGVKKIIVTHPLASFVNYTIDDMKGMLDLGATYLEHVYNDTTRQVSQPIKRETIFEAVEAVGARHCILSTDAGQWLNPIPSQQMGIYIKDALDYGITAEHIRMMVQDNPAAALGI